MKKLLLLLTLLGACVSGVMANNIRIIGLPVLEGQNEKEHSIKIKFDLAWDNSWRTSKPNNYDAAWIFVKCWDGESWNHVYLEKDSAIAGSTKATDAVNLAKFFERCFGYLMQLHAKPQEISSRSRENLL